MMIVKNVYCANSLNYLSINIGIRSKYILGLFNSKLLNFVFTKFSTNSNVNGYEIDNLPVKIDDKFVQPIQFMVDYVLFLKEKEKEKESYLLENIIDAVVYELYFPVEVKEAGCEILKHISNLPELKEDCSDDKKLQTINRVYKEFSSSNHPISAAILKMQNIEEVAIIGGRK